MMAHRWLCHHLKVQPIHRHKQQQPSAAGKLNHLGIEVESSAKVAQASDRCQPAHLQVQAEPQTTCCYALQDKILVKEMKPPILTRPPTMFSYDCPPRISGN